MLPLMSLNSAGAEGTFVSITSFPADAIGSGTGAISARGVVVTDGAVGGLDSNWCRLGHIVSPTTSSCATRRSSGSTVERSSRTRRT